jgi:hypothetical protein
MAQIIGWATYLVRTVLAKSHQHSIRALLEAASMDL